MGYTFVRKDDRGGRVGALVFALAFALVATLGVVSSPSGVDAQEFPGIGGFDLRIGGNSPSPDGQGGGISTAIDADLGFIGDPNIRAIVGFNLFRGSVQQVDLDDGSFTAAGIRAGLRADFQRLGQVRPYALGAVTGHNVTADVLDPATEDLLEGFYGGAALGVGAMVALDEPNQFGVVGEIRRLFANNIGGWAFEVGFRWMPRGETMYDRPRDRTPRRSSDAPDL